MENRQQKSTSTKGTKCNKISNSLFSYINDSTIRTSASISSLNNYNIIIPQTSSITKFEELYNNNIKNTD
jgi:hypothetical protein